MHELRDRLRRVLGPARLKNATLRRVLLGGLFFALLTLILSTQVVPQRLDVKEGAIAPRDVAAPRDIQNRLATLRAKEAAAAATAPVMKADPAVFDQADAYVTYAFDDIKKVRGLPNQDAKTRADTLANQLNLGTVPPETYAALLTASDQVLDLAAADAHRLVKQALSGTVDKADVTDLKAKIDEGQDPYSQNTQEPWLKSFVKEVAKSHLKANAVVDLEATKAVQKVAADRVQPIIWKQDQLIIKRGDPVTDEQYATLQDLHLVGAHVDIRSIFGTAVLSFVFVALTALYLMRYRPDILEKDSKLILLGLIGVATIVLNLLMKVFSDTLGTSVGYLMPVAVNSMLVAILLEPRLALLQGAILAMTVGILTDVDQVSYTLVALVGSSVGVYAVKRLESRTDIYRAGLLVTLANVITIMGIYLMKAYSILDPRPWIDAGLGAINGLVVAVLVTGALPFFENLFGVVTPLKLLELSNPNHPLLKRLLVEAPGSYHHTILVANLCEAAAEAIGADPVLARVGAYYHDIGKTKRPYFFVENQMGGENPHTKLPPSLSALIITSHVKDGLEMAREARLPKEVADFIPEHHGTTLVSYFYHMASKNGQSEYVLEEDFRYDGPKPRSKETAICMLADGCEASVRAIRQKGPLTLEQLEQQVRRIIEDRLRQGQLDNCDLTLRELEGIAKTFVRVLSGVHHARVEYPAEMQGALPADGAPAPAEEAESGRDEVQEEKTDGDLDQQRSGESGAGNGAGGNGPLGGGAGA
ncbi:MAG: HD family phosphohydrolase [Mycobacterium leprae]